jgi:hypothetical protein
MIDLRRQKPLKGIKKTIVGEVRNLQKKEI